MQTSEPPHPRHRALAVIDGQDDPDSDYRLHRRFDRMGRLIGDTAMSKLFGSHVMVIGLGGVGSFAVESLARSGVGRLTLIDFDKVCVTNTNRQLQAMQQVVGQYKAPLLAERVAHINPRATAVALEEFYEADNSERIFAMQPDFIVDAIDNITAKCHLLAACKRRGVPVVSSTGASGRMDPTRLKIADLAATEIDPLAATVRRVLRTEYDFPRKGDFGVQAVFSTEPPQPPVDLHYDRGQGFRCVCPGGANDKHSCEQRAVIYGTASFVTGAFGLACASVAVQHLVAPASGED